MLQLVKLHLKPAQLVMKKMLRAGVCVTKEMKSEVKKGIWRKKRVELEGRKKDTGEQPDKRRRGSRERKRLKEEKRRGERE